jgi:hypothetical protein
MARKRPDPTRRKIPTGAGSHFTLTATTIRFPIDAPAFGMRPHIRGSRGGGDAFELLVAAGGYGQIVLVPPGCVLTRQDVAQRLSPVAAVEMLRRTNVYRLSTGRPTLEIPAALVKRAKAEVAPGIEALVAFPGQLKTYYAGRGAWVGVGLWVSANGEHELEMPGGDGWLRKSLSPHDGRLWLEANGHGEAETYFAGAVPSRDGGGEWRSVTKQTAAGEARAAREQKRVEQKLRAAVAAAPPRPAPTISPPRRRKAARRRPR